MRLLLVEPAPHGGLLHYVVQLADALANRGHSVDLLVARDNELVGRSSRARMLAELPRLVNSSEPPPAGLSYRRRQARVGLRLVRCWARIIAEGRRAEHDAMISGADTTVIPTAAAALLLTMVPGRPVLARICHNARTSNRWEGDDYRGSPVLEALHNRAYPRFDLTLFPGERSQSEYETYRPRSRAAIVPHGDERMFAEEPPPPAPEERILFFGEWRKIKGLSVLMDAFDELVSRRPTVRLTIAGLPIPSDCDPEPIRRWAAAHGDAVEVIDRYVPLDEVPGIFGRARVVVTPYLAGSQSGVIALAMTMGRAVVTTDVGELGAVVKDGEAGRVVPPGNPTALAAALEEVVADSDLAVRYGTEGRRRGLEAYSWEQAAERLEEALQPLVTERRHALTES